MMWDLVAEALNNLIFLSCRSVVLQAENNRERDEVRLI